jgi:predicted nucleotidyltransferase
MAHQPNNLSAGTQVVARIEVRGTNNSLVHPRGAVGVVTRTPAVAGEKFLVRFPDGFEAAFRHEQLEVLKHFKDRLGKVGRVTPCAPGASFSDPARADLEIGASTGLPDSGFERESCIIYRCVVGSRAYGLDTDDSDTDRRGIYLAPAELQWSLFGAPEQFEDNATQSCYWELQKFLTMALKANPNILECLWSPMVEKVTELGAELIAVREHFLSQMIFQTFNGYAMSQFKKIEQDIRNQPSREAKWKVMAAAAKSVKDEGGSGASDARYGSTNARSDDGIRWKHAMHLLRLLLTGAATLRTGNVPVRVEAHRDRLLAVKRGELPWAEVDAWRKELHRDFELALAETKLPERPDYEKANEFLINARKKMVK